MAGIIWFVVVMYIVIRCVAVSKQKNGQTRANVPRQPAQSNRSNRGQTGWGQSAGQMGGGQPHRGNAQPQRMPAKQQTRTAQPTGGARAPRTVREPQQNTILQKAKENTSKQFSDDSLKNRGSADLNRVPFGDEIMKDKAKARHIHSEHEADHGAELQNQPGVDDFDTYHLIDEVNDLIVKGYSGNLEFERDFLSEATDMLNRMYG